MNKLNNNEALQMTTVMPTMKKSLLALAVAGTMAMSGGVYAANNDIVVTSGAGTDFTNADGTAITAAGTAGVGLNDHIVVTGISTAAGNTSAVVKADSAMTIVTEDAEATATVGTIAIAEATDLVTISSGFITSPADVTLTMGAVTGLGTLTIDADGAATTTAGLIVVTGGVGIGVANSVLAGVNITAGDLAAEDATLTVSDGDTVYSDILLTDGSAGSAALILGTSTNGTSVVGDITSAADGAGLITVVDDDDASVTGRIGTSASVGMGDVRVVGATATLTLQALVAGDGLYVAGKLDSDSADTRGGVVTLNAGAAATHTAVGVTQISLIDGTTTLTALNINGGTGGLSTDAAIAGQAGGASSITLTGAADISTFTITGGTGGAGMAAGGATATAGGAGGATTATVTAALTGTTVNVVGGTAGTGGAGTVSAVGAVGGAGGTATLNLNADITANLNITATDGGTGGALSSLIGGVGGAGGSALVTIAGNVTGDITMENGDAGTTPASGGAGGAGGSTTVTFDGDSAQTVVGSLIATGDGEGNLSITNQSAAGVVFNGDLGVAAKGFATLNISTGATMTHKAKTIATPTLDITGTTSGGGTLILSAGDAITATVGLEYNTALMVGDITLAALTIRGGAGATGVDGSGAIGGAFSDYDASGAVNLTTLNILGGTAAIGDTNDVSDTGGNGGAVTAADFAGLVTATTVNLTGAAGAVGGDGGAAADGAAGGDGGSVKLALNAGLTGAIVVTSGAGGNAGALSTNAGGNGGDGGDVVLTDISAAGVLTTVQMTAGDGGDGSASDAGGSGAGGVGGFITVTGLANASTGLTLTAGAGGDGAAGTGANAGGAGGIAGSIGFVTTTSANAGAASDITGAIVGNVILTAGNGGAAGAAGAAVGGIGGDGGGILLTSLGTITGNTTMTGGNGGAGSAANSTAAGVAGGESASNIVSLIDSSTGAITLTGGNGGAGKDAALGGAGGAGGDAGAVTITSITAHSATTATTGSNATLTAGNAGHSGANTAAQNGGIGGIGSNVTATFAEASTPDFATLTVAAGNGGNGRTAVSGNATTTAAAAAGAAVLVVTTNAVAATNAIEATTIDITAGNAGNAGNSNVAQIGGVGSAGGDSTVTFGNNLTAQGATGSSTITLTGGNGGNGGNAGTGVAGAAGVAGGTAQLNLDGTSTFYAANITLDDGTAGTAGTVSGSFAGGVAGEGGGAVLDFNATTLVTFTGTITAASDGEGSITVANAALTIDGSIGTSAKELDDLTVTSEIVTTNNNLYIKDIVLNDDSADLNLNGTTAKVVSGAITGASLADITTGASSIWTFEGAVGKNSAGTVSAVDIIDLDAVGTTTTFNSTVNAASILTSSTGTVTFNDLVTTTGLTVANLSTITLGTGFVAGETVFMTTAAFAGRATINMPQTFNTGSITLINDTATTAGANALLLDFNTNVLSTYTAAANTDDDTKLDVTAVRKTAALVASELNITTDQANALHQSVTSVATEDATGLAAMNTILAAGVTSANVEQLQPDVTSANGASLASVNAVNNVIAGRQANTKIAFNTLGKQSGVSTGDAANDLTVWAQIFGSNANQDAVGTMDGYDADSAGLALGWEANKSGDLMGLSVSYSDADVDGKSASVSHTDSTAVQASVYGTYNKSTDWMIGYALANNDTSRTINLGGLSRTASGSYDSGIMSAKIGHTFATSGGLTPKVDASWTRVDNDGYTETGADNLGLIVADSDHDVVTLRAGGEMAQKVSNGTARFSVMGGYDVVNDNVVSTATFIGGGSSFTTTGADAEKVSLQLGFGYDSVVSDDSTVSLDLNADLRSNYDSMSGSLMYKSKF